MTKKEITKKYAEIFKKNPFARKWKLKLAKLIILLLVLGAIISLSIFQSEPTFTTDPQEYQP